MRVEVLLAFVNKYDIVPVDIRQFRKPVDIHIHVSVVLDQTEIGQL